MVVVIAIVKSGVDVVINTRVKLSPISLLPSDDTGVGKMVTVLEVESNSGI